jgi:hypothetical protein
MAKYLDKEAVDIIINSSKEIVKIRNRVLQETSVDLLDTDSISAAFIHEIVTQYDIDYNTNFSRFGEDGKSNGVLLEHKASKVKGQLTPTGKVRVGYGTDAVFQFHAMGDIDCARYIFVARHEETLELLRMYDISAEDNRLKVLKHLQAAKDEYLAIGFRKRDIISLSEKFILENLTFPHKQTIGNCVILRDNINT